MATKFILVGGYPRKAPDWGKVFCEEVIKGFKPPVKILDCLFARPKKDWDKAYAELKNYKEDLPIYALREGEFVVIEQ